PGGVGAVSVRGGRTQPAGLQDVGGSRGRPPPAARGAGAPVTQPGAPQGGDREPREPGGGLRAPQASAPGPRSTSAERGLRPASGWAGWGWPSPTAKPA